MEIFPFSHWFIHLQEKKFCVFLLLSPFPASYSCVPWYYPLLSPFFKKAFCTFTTEEKFLLKVHARNSFGQNVKKWEEEENSSLSWFRILIQHFMTKSKCFTLELRQKELELECVPMILEDRKVRIVSRRWRVNILIDGYKVWSGIKVGFQKYQKNSGIKHSKRRF